MGVNKIIEFDAIVVQKKGLDSTDMDGEVVMMNIDKGNYYGFNSVGSRIWEIIERPMSVEKIISTLLKEFNVDTKTCEDEVLSFLNGLCYEELISIN
jgi:hypothetical protein